MLSSIHCVICRSCKQWESHIIPAVSDVCPVTGALTVYLSQLTLKTVSSVLQITTGCQILLQFQVNLVLKRRHHLISFSVDYLNITTCKMQLFCSIGVVSVWNSHVRVNFILD